MPQSPSEASRGNAAAWQIAVQPRGVSQALAPLPDASLSREDADDPGKWASSAERPCFGVPVQQLQGGGLAAGWYVLGGRLDIADGRATTPCLYPGYVGGADGEMQIGLPDPDNDGRIDALVLFKYDVVSLRFSPGHGPVRFRMDGFLLRRLSRASALLRMLGSARGKRARSVGDAFIRGFRFCVDVLRIGVSPATDALFAAHRRRVMPAQLNEYAGWSARFDTLTAEMMNELHARAERLGPDGPLISVLVPAYRTPERWLRRCIESVIAQAYPKWQLCIADDASPDARVMDVVQEYAVLDDRIRFVRRGVNGHISASSNSALEIAQGEYVAFLDHDDELRPHALLEMAEAIDERPDTCLLYSDEDKIDTQGRRFDPYFKPEWDPDLLRSQNYVCHLTCIRTDLVREVGGFREGLEGSQDHDLVLRCSERLRPAQIRHIPKVLYHWRAITGSTALSRDAKDYASAAGVRAVADHLRRRYPEARAEELAHGHYRVKWPLPEPAPKVSLIVPTRDKVELLRVCVDSILDRTDYSGFEVVVVDNRSSDPEALDYLEALQRRERTRVLRYDAPFNFSAINNWAVSQCDGTIVGLINNDIEVIHGDWLQEMASQALRPDVGAVGAMLYYPDDTIQHAGVVLGVHGVAAHAYAGMPRGYPGHGGRARVAQTLSAVTGACLLVRRALYEHIGGLDEALQIAFNDIDFCLRLRAAGYRNIWTPFAELYHHESASRGSEDTDEKKQRFMGEVDFMQQRWGELLLDDPAYNVNLSLTSLCSDLSVPPRQ